MNLLKKFLGNDNAREEEDIEEEFDDLYLDDDIKADVEESQPAPTATGAMGNVKAPISTATQTPAQPDKVALKLMQPKSHTESTKIADKLKEGNIVLLDISKLERDQANRLVHFMAGAVYVLGGQMIKTNRSTIVVSPAGVDITGLAQDLGAEPAPAPKAPQPEEEPAEEPTEE